MRRVGVEIEFAGLTPGDAARLVGACFGGNAVQGDTQHYFDVKGARWGDFSVELDTQFVNPDQNLKALLEDSPLAPTEDDLKTVGELDTQVRDALGKAVTGIVPTEIVSPPIPWKDLGALATLTDALRQNGAKGTDEGAMYAFGVHLNPEVPGESVGDILPMLRAYLILSDWLRNQIDVNPTRRLMPHIDPFPEDYVLKVLAPSYKPDLKTLIRDYVGANPTRNRELDMMPLFKHVDAETLGELIDDPRIKARPTFHYRLPDTHLSDPDWTIVSEWNRWVAVERLAADRSALARLAKDRIEQTERPLVDRIKEVSSWLASLANL